MFIVSYEKSTDTCPICEAGREDFEKAKVGGGGVVGGGVGEVGGGEVGRGGRLISSAGQKVSSSINLRANS